MVTARHLDDERERLQLAINQSIDGIAIANASRVITYANTAWATMHGMSTNDVLGLNLNIFRGRARDEPNAPADSSTSNDSTIIEEALHQRADGTLFNAMISTTPILTAAQKKVGYIAILRDITEKKKTLDELDRYRNHLEHLVEERTNALAIASRRLVEASRKAGMAEVATGVLHNIGNILNSVNVGLETFRTIASNLKIKQLERTVELLDQNRDNLGDFITKDKRGKLIPTFLREVTKTLENEQQDMLQGIEELQQKAGQIATIVTLQQSYATYSGTVELCQLSDIIADAIQINMAALHRHQVDVRTHFDDMPPIYIDKHKVMQIVINLISNAKYSYEHFKQSDCSIDIYLKRSSEDRVQIIVEDEGRGISRDNLTRIFNYGFTTRKDGHGFGLHNSGNTAHELGGTLTAFSEGEGSGAKFVLEIPVDYSDLEASVTVPDPDKAANPPGQ